MSAHTSAERSEHRVLSEGSETVGEEWGGTRRSTEGKGPSCGMLTGVYRISTTPFRPAVCTGAAWSLQLASSDAEGQKKMIVLPLESWASQSGRKAQDLSSGGESLVILKRSPFPRSVPVS